MKKILLYCMLLISCTSFSQSWLWGRQGRGGIKCQDFGGPLAADKEGNVYSAGNMVSSIFFGPDSASGSGAYIVKYSLGGKLIWLKPIGIMKSNYLQNIVTSIAVDKADNIFITGYFTDTISFGSFTLITHENDDFILKYDSSGAIQWAKQSISGVAGYEQFNNYVATDQAGNAYVTGSFYDTISFGTAKLINPSTMNLGNGSSDVFLVKYDPSGNVLWAKQSLAPFPLSNGFNMNCPSSIAVDNSNNIYVAGNFDDTISFGTFSLSSVKGKNHNPAVFLTKYDQNGNIIWAKNSTIPNDNGPSIGTQVYPNVGIFASSVTTDKTGNVYIAGGFNDTVSFSGYSLYCSNRNEEALFLVKYNSLGNVIWAQQSATNPDTVSSIPYTIQCDNSALYLTCGTWYNGLLDTGIHVHENIKFNSFSLAGASAGQWPPSSYYIIKFDTSGIAHCGSATNSRGAELKEYYRTPYTDMLRLASDPTGAYVYVGATVYDTLIFNKDTLWGIGGGFIGGGFDPFIARWNSCDGVQGINEIEGKNDLILLYPNPNNGKFTLELESKALEVHASVNIFNLFGEQVYANNLNTAEAQIDLSSYASGIYLYRVITESGGLLSEGKFIIQH